MRTSLTFPPFPCVSKALPAFIESSTVHFLTSSSSHPSMIRTSAQSSTLSNSTDALPPRVLARVAREVRDLIKTPPDGIKLVVDRETGLPPSLSEIVGELEGPTGTPYEKKYFHIKLDISTDFPDCPPKGFFSTKIYHPNVDMSTGAICVNTLKKDWNSSLTLSHVFNVIRCLLIIPFPESSLNDEAGKLFMESYDEYARRAKLMAGIHGRSHPYNIEEMEVPICPISPSKSAKENESDLIAFGNGKSIPVLTSILKQSNGGGSNGNLENIDGEKLSAKAAVLSTKETNTFPVEKSSALEKKSSKKSLKRL